MEVLTHLEAKTGKSIHELFDLICGVSTGAVIAVLLGAHRLSLPACRELYWDISNKVFSQTTLKGTTNLVWRNSFYDSDAWTNILKEEMGDIPMIDTARDPRTTKVEAIRYLLILQKKICMYETNHSKRRKNA